MNNFLNDNWFNLILLILLLPAYKGITKAIENGIAKIPDRNHDKQMEKLKNENKHLLQKDDQQSTKELQIDSYYRSISGKELEKIFSKWTEMIVDSKKMNHHFSKQQGNLLLKDLIMYGSSETTRLGAIFMDYCYRYWGEDMEEQRPVYEAMYLLARIVSSLKSDFTGHYADPIDLLKMKNKDLHIEPIKTQIQEAKKNVENIIANGFPE